MEIRRVHSGHNCTSRQEDNRYSFSQKERTTKKRHKVKNDESKGENYCEKETSSSNFLRLYASFSFCYGERVLLVFGRKVRRRGFLTLIVFLILSVF